MRLKTRRLIIMLTSVLFAVFITSISAEALSINSSASALPKWLQWMGKKDKAEENKPQQEKKIILIDPGHGGMDGGAVGHDGTIEKNINLRIALKLKEKLLSENFQVVMTREGDYGLYRDDSKNKKVEDLKSRCNMKKSSNCDVFISIHCNKFPKKRYRGAQVWYSMAPGGKELAHILQEELNKGLGDFHNRVEKSANTEYRILRNDGTTSVIVECGFLSNPEEEALLNTPLHQQKIAEIITQSLKMYFEESGAKNNN